MRASDVPIDDLRRKYQADPGSLTVEEFEALARYKKLVATPTPAAKQSGPPRPPKRKPGRKRKETLLQKVERLRGNDLELIEAKLARGETLTASDRKVIADVVAQTTAPETVSKTREVIDFNIQKELQNSRLRAFHKLNALLESKREDIAFAAAQALRLWADREELPPDDYTLAPANPAQAKPEHSHPEQAQSNVISIKTGVA